MNPERNTPQIHIYTYLYVEPKHREKINPDTVKDLLTRKYLHTNSKIHDED